MTSLTGYSLMEYTFLGGAANDENFVSLTTFSFQWYKSRINSTQTGWEFQYTFFWNLTGVSALSQYQMSSQYQLTVTWWRHMATEIWVDIGPGNGDTKPLPEPKLIRDDSHPPWCNFAANAQYMMGKYNLKSINIIQNCSETSQDLMMRHITT